MKGLILKDIYVIAKRCKMYLALVVLFAALSVITGKEANLFFLFYPMVLICNLPVTLISFDEKSNWEQYAQTMPCTRRQMVAAKYVVMLLSFLTVALILGLTQLISLSVHGVFQWEPILAAAGVGLVASCVMMPIVFRFGLENGRVVYLTMVIVVCTSLGVVRYTASSFQPVISLDGIRQMIWILVVVALLALIVSWKLSEHFYENREFYKK